MVEKDELLKQVWPDTFVEEGVLAVNVAALRKALNEGQEGPSLISHCATAGIPVHRGRASVRRDRPAVVHSPHRRSWGDSSRFRELTQSSRLLWFSLHLWWVQGGGLSVIPRCLGQAPKLTRITSDSGLTYHPALSPDGTLVAYPSRLWW